MPSTDLLGSYFDFWVSNMGTNVLETNTKPDNFNLLSFLATVQHLQIQFLPLAWDVGRGLVGIGGTSRIHQALMDINTSFAFKTFHKRHIPEERVFRSLTTEITVLSQPFVREHPNISQLQGISWDISPDDDKPWPVLVFEKSHLGDLYHFVQHSGKNMSLEERLGLCSDIGNAIMDMHANYIVHGDIKPENVLVFRDKSGKYRARLIDFGYSSRYAHDAQQLELPRSRPWNAPENEGHMPMWTPAEAVKSDLFCLGMVYFWLLFEPHLRVMARPGQNIQKSIQDFYTTDYRVRSYIAQRLCDQSSESASIALQAALCYHIGFGVRRNEAKVKELLDQSKRTMEAIDNMIAHSDIVYDIFETTTASRLSRMGISLGSSFAHIYLAQGRLDQAEKSLLQEKMDLKSTYGTNHTLFSIISDGLSGLFDLQGRWEEAEELEVQVMETSKMKLGEDHPNTLTSMANLASTYENQGRWEEAEKLEVQVMGTSRMKLGEDHPDTLTSIANLAMTYRNQGRWEEAEKLQVQVMETSKMKLGEDHPNTLTSMANLASIYGKQGRWEEAEELEVQVMETSKLKLGEDHPLTLTIMANLAMTYSDQGRWEEAEKLEVQVMETRKMKLGEDHPDTLTIMANLASTYKNQGRWDEAEKLEVQVMETRKMKVSGNVNGSYGDMEVRVHA
ncbi:hypothetical protein HZS61_004309 [Fusarium oxysporum f. sp. conglutinans]|uniref:Protein kinase domain-containing protein n=1 Tax=Fusarium oxysporum f. sp. conglutinans TaxID=100902 RepID=A0A8H6LDV5_FUSOX|nr:hypothetical protein HZS61_004309 [Fusarium oxysporum f. sp. conglutinans]